MNYINSLCSWLHSWIAYPQAASDDTEIQDIFKQSVKEFEALKEIKVARLQNKVEFSQELIGIKDKITLIDSQIRNSSPVLSQPEVITVEAPITTEEENPVAARIAQLKQEYGNEEVEEVLTYFQNQLSSPEKVSELLRMRKEMSRLGQEAIKALCLDDITALHRPIQRKWVQAAIETRIALDSYQRQLKLHDLGVRGDLMSPASKIRMVEILRQVEECNSTEEALKEIRSIRGQLKQTNLSGPQLAELHFIRHTIEEAITVKNGLENKTDLNEQFKDFYVIPPTDLTNTNNSWVIVQALSKKADPRAFAAQFHNNTQQADETVRITKDGQFKYFSEKSETVFQNNMSREIGNRSRLVTGKDGKVIRENRPEKGFVSLGKNEKFTKNRLVTAAVDRLESIATYRLLAKQVLAGEKVSLNQFLRIKEYFKSVSTNDVAGFKGSYITDPVFIESFHHFGQIEESLKKAIGEQTQIQQMQMNPQKGDKNPDYHTGLKRLIEVAKIFKRWNLDIEAFIVVSESDKAFAKKCEWYVNCMKQILEHVKKIATSFPDHLDHYDLDIKSLREKMGAEEAVRISTAILEILTDRKMETLSLVAAPLQEAEASPAIQQTRIQLFNKFSSVLPTGNTAVTYAFQFGTRITDCLNGFLDSIGPQNKPLNELALKAKRENAQQTVNRESLRSSQRPQDANSKTVIKRYFPNGV